MHTAAVLVISVRYIHLRQRMRPASGADLLAYLMEHSYLLSAGRDNFPTELLKDITQHRYLVHVSNEGRDRYISPVEDMGVNVDSKRRSWVAYTRIVGAEV